MCMTMWMNMWTNRSTYMCTHISYKHLNMWRSDRSVLPRMSRQLPALVGSAAGLIISEPLPQMLGLCVKTTVDAMTTMELCKLWNNDWSLIAAKTSYHWYNAKLHCRAACVQMHWLALVLVVTLHTTRPWCDHSIVEGREGTPSQTSEPNNLGGSSTCMQQHGHRSSASLRWCGLNCNMQCPCVRNVFRMCQFRISGYPEYQLNLYLVMFMQWIWHWALICGGENKQWTQTRLYVI